MRENLLIDIKKTKSAHGTSFAYVQLVGATKKDR